MNPVLQETEAGFRRMIAAQSERLDSPADCALRFARLLGKIDVFFTDLTLQKRAEQILLQTEKLTAVGRLASSISHEINNPLEAVTDLLYVVRNSFVPVWSSGGLLE